MSSVFINKKHRKDHSIKTINSYVSANAGGLLVYVTDHLTLRELREVELPLDIPLVFIEPFLRKTE